MDVDMKLKVDGIDNLKAALRKAQETLAAFKDAVGELEDCEITIREETGAKLNHEQS